eukprot:3413511-Pyramimonas_sp.AAC.1
MVLIGRLSCHASDARRGLRGQLAGQRPRRGHLAVPAEPGRRPADLPRRVNFDARQFIGAHFQWRAAI